MTTLDVSNQTDLLRFSCSSNQLTNLDVSNQPDLGILWCGNNQLTNLDVSNQPDLRILSCGGNQLTSLDISNNSKLGEDVWNWADCFLEIGDMPSLEKVCVWTVPFPSAGFLLNAEGSPNIYYTSDCTTAL